MLWQHAVLETMRYIIIWSIFNVQVNQGSGCVLRYAAEQLTKYHCNSEYHFYHTNIERQQCTQTCMTDPRCWVLSYNFVNQSCLLGNKPCAVADVYPDSLLVIFRESPNELCTTWIPPFNDPGYIYFSKRLVETHPHPEYHYAVGRMAVGSDTHLGVVAFPSAAGNGWFAVGRAIVVKEPTNYELLSVSPKCTLVWVPYKAGDVMPPGALKLGYLTGEGHSYSIRVYLFDRDIYAYGVYITGDSVGYYTYNGVKTLTVMEILTQVWDWTA